MLQQPDNHIPHTIFNQFLHLVYDFYAKSRLGPCVPFEEKVENIQKALKLFETNENVVRTAHLSLTHLCRLPQPPYDFSWLRSDERHNSLMKRRADVYGDTNSVYQAYKETGIYIAANIERFMQKTRPTHVALYFSEAMAISIRASARRKLSQMVEANNIKNKELPEYEPHPLGYIADSNDMLLKNQALPRDTTIVQLAFDANDYLWLIRYNPNHEIFSIPIRHVPAAGSMEAPFERGCPLLGRMRQVLEESERSTKRKYDDGNEFWARRKALDSQYQELLLQFESKWLGHFRALLKPFAYNSLKDPNVGKVMDEIRAKRLPSSEAMILTMCVDKCTESEFVFLFSAIAERVAAFAPLGQKPNTDKLEQNFQRWRKLLDYSKLKRNDEDAFLFLSLPGSISFIPWEALSVFDNVLVSRVNSIFVFDMLKSKHETMPKSVDLRNGYFILNPAGDLKNTEERLGKIVSKSSWNGVIGRAPPKEEAKKALESNDMYVFLGHGHGLRYLGSTSELQKAECKAVCLLMGCSSVEIVDEGRGYDGRAVLHEFIVANCPCVVGCLYMVTDGELDCIFVELLRYCNMANDSGKSVTEADGYRLILRGLQNARKECRLKLLSGFAVVCYGLPTCTRNPDPELCKVIPKKRCNTTKYR